MGAVHYLPAVGTPLLIKQFHRPHPTPRHLLCCPLATNPHAVSLRPAGYSLGYAGYSPGYAGYSPGYAGYSPGYAGYSLGYAGYSLGYAGYSPGYAGYSRGKPERLVDPQRRRCAKYRPKLITPLWYKYK